MFDKAKWLRYIIAISNKNKEMWFIMFRLKEEKSYG